MPIIQADRLRMKSGCRDSDDVREIDEIYLKGGGLDQFYEKEAVHEFIRRHPRSIRVNLYPYPYLVPAESENGEKYVRSQPDDTPMDNLLKLRRV